MSNLLLQPLQGTVIHEQTHSLVLKKILTWFKSHYTLRFHFTVAVSVSPLKCQLQVYFTLFSRFVTRKRNNCSFRWVKLVAVSIKTINKSKSAPNVKIHNRCVVRVPRQSPTFHVDLFTQPWFSWMKQEQWRNLNTLFYAHLVCYAKQGPILHLCLNMS